MKIYIIEVYVGNDRWLPMYQPCYSLEEAQRKQRTKKYSQTRIAVYNRDMWIDGSVVFPRNDSPRTLAAARAKNHG